MQLLSGEMSDVKMSQRFAEFEPWARSQLRVMSSDLTVCYPNKRVTYRHVRAKCYTKNSQSEYSSLSYRTCVKSVPWVFGRMRIESLHVNPSENHVTDLRDTLGKSEQLKLSLSLSLSLSLLLWPEGIHKSILAIQHAVMLRGETVIQFGA